MINSPWVSRPIPGFRLWQADLVYDFGNIVMAVGNPDVLYCAPPNAEHHKFWWNHDYDYPTFLKSFIDLVKVVGAPITVLDCFTSKDAVVEGLAGYWKHCDLRPVTYEAPTSSTGKGRASKPGATQIVLSNQPLGKREERAEPYGSREALQSILSTMPPSTVFDPCVGKGLAMQVAFQLGHRGVGIDVNNQRLRATETWLLAQPHDRSH